jgi:hypothetical protein
MADEPDDRPAYTSKLGDRVKNFVDEVTSITELLSSVVTMAAFIGGILLVSYASKEHFFYDLSSVAAIGPTAFHLLYLLFFPHCPPNILLSMYVMDSSRHIPYHELVPS